MVNAFELKRELEARGFKTKISVVEKNGVMKTGISILSDNIITPVFYINDCIGSPADVAESIINIYFDYKEDCNGYVETVKNLTWDKAKDNIYICVQPFVNEANYITKKYLDLQMYVRLFLKNDTSVKLNQYMLDIMDITEYEMWKQAKINTESILTAKCIGATLQEFGEDCSEFSADEFKYPIVLTTKTKLFGASWICFKDKLHEFAKTIGDNLYIIPSSIHEILLVPAFYVVDDLMFLKLMVEEVNETVDPTEILGYNIYKYNKDNKELFIVI